MTLRLILQGVGFFTGLVRGDACLDACHCLPGVVRGERIQALGKALRCIGPREAVGEEGVQTSGSVDCLIGLAHDAPRTLAHIWNPGANAISLIEYRAVGDRGGRRMSNTRRLPIRRPRSHSESR